LLLKVVAKIGVECGRKMDQIQKTKFPKKCNGNKIKEARGAWASNILPLGPFNSTSTVTRNIIYESWR